jgi:hypothetical protein
MLVAERTAAEWVAGFAEGWRAPTDADSFCDHFEPYLDDEIRLVQPQLPPVVGKRAFREQFASLDPLELLGPVALSPRAWPAFVRARFAR